MKSSKVFLCPVCKHQFNTASRTPLTLECGDVVCKHCMTFSPSHCPIDQTRITKPIESIPICKAILQHLPSHMPESPVNNPESHSQRAESAPPIKNNSSSSPLKQKIFQELDCIQLGLNNKSQEMNSKLLYWSNLKIAWIDSTKKQLQSFDVEINKLISSIITFKSTVDEQIKDIFNQETSKIEQWKTSYNQQKECLVEMSYDIKKLYTIINSCKPERIDDGIVKEKNKIISNWEILLKTEGKTYINKSKEFLVNINISPNFLSLFNDLLESNIAIDKISFDSYNNKSIKNLNVNANANANANETGQQNRYQAYQTESTNELTRKNSDPKTNTPNLNRTNTNPNWWYHNTDKKSNPNKWFIFDLKWNDKPIVWNNNYLNIANEWREEKRNGNGMWTPKLKRNIYDSSKKKRENYYQDISMAKYSPLLTE